MKNSETSGQKKEEVEKDIIRENKKTLRLRYNRVCPSCRPSERRVLVLHVGLPPERRVPSIQRQTHIKRSVEPVI